MEQLISEMLGSYEQGKITRRQLLQGLAALATATPGGSAYESTFRGVALNHVAIRVTDVRRSREFYQKHLGLPVIRESKTNCFLGLGKNFLTLFENQQPGLDHFCVAIENYDAGRVMAKLGRAALKPNRPEGTDRVYFQDPDGLTVQLSSINHHA